MITHFIITSIAVSGATLLWRSFLYDNASLRAALKNNLPKAINHALTCGLCFTYWLSLATVIIFNPLEGWTPPLRLTSLEPATPFISLILSWMAIGAVASFIRFTSAAIQEFVHYEIHHLNHREH